MAKKLVTITLLTMAALQLCLAARPRAARLLSRLPLPVQQTITAQLADGRVTGVETDRDEGILSYDISIVRDGQPRDFSVGADGKLIDQQVFINELPSAVQSAIQSAAGTGSIDDIYQSIDDGHMNYDADIVTGGHERDYTFADDGRLLTREVFLTELASSAQKTIQQKAAGASIDEIDESYENVAPDYDVQIIRDGRSRDFSVSTNGDVINEQLFLAELPNPLQTAIRAESKGAGIGDIYRSADSDETNYDVDMGEGTAARTLTFDEDGTISGVEQAVNLTDTPGAVQDTVKSLDGKILGIDKSMEDGDVSYDVDLVVNGRFKSVNIDTNGKISADAD